MAIKVFINPIKNIIDLSKEYYYAINSLNRLNNLLDIDSEDISTKTNNIITGNIKFNHLYFSYNGENRILNNINLVFDIDENINLQINSFELKSILQNIILFILDQANTYEIKKCTIKIEVSIIHDEVTIKIIENIENSDKKDFLEG